MKIEQCQWSAEQKWQPSAPGGLGAEAQLVLLFGNSAPAGADAFFSEVQRAYPRAQVFGCSTGGEIQGSHLGDETMALTAVALEHSRVATVRTPIDGVGGSFAAGAALARQLDPRGLRHVFVLSEGLQVNGSDLVSGINSGLPSAVTFSGGFAADGNRLQKTQVWCDGKPEPSAAVALGFYGDRLKIGVGVTGGWRPFGPDRLITKSRKNVLYEFDGRPALALYRQYLGDHAAGLPASGLLFPLEIRSPDRQGRMLRALLAVDEAEQSITFAGNVPEGSYARLMFGRIEDMIGGAFTAAQTSTVPFDGRPPDLSVVVSCNARRAVLKQRTEEELEAAYAALGAGTAATGFYSYGEIAPSAPGLPSELHNETLVVTSLSEQSNEGG